VELYLHSPNTPSRRGSQAQGQLYLYLIFLTLLNNLLQENERNACYYSILGSGSSSGSGGGGGGDDYDDYD